MKEIQDISYEEFEKYLDSTVSGMSKKNTCRVFSIPPMLPSELEITEKGFSRKASRMLNPPVSLFSIPAMRKLAKEIASWKEIDCFKHMIAYAGLTPPLVPRDLFYNDGLRFEQARVLNELGQKCSRSRWVAASSLFVRSGDSIIHLCEKALTYDGTSCSEYLGQIADIEEEAYKLLI